MQHQTDDPGARTQTENKSLGNPPPAPADRAAHDEAPSVIHPTKFYSKEELAEIVRMDAGHFIRVHRLKAVKGTSKLFWGNHVIEALNSGAHLRYDSHRYQTPQVRAPRAAKGRREGRGGDSDPQRGSAFSARDALLGRKR